MPGLSEWVIILIIVFIIFGAGKLPSVGEALGRSIRSFKKAAGSDDKKTDEKVDEKVEKDTP